MAKLTLAQQALLEKARSVGSSDMAVPLSDSACSFLCATTILDLGKRDQFPEIPENVGSFFETWPVSKLELDVPFEELAAKAFSAIPDSDTYFSCLATLHKSRLKYEQILKRQAMPTFDQVGPRGLLQFGSLPPASLSALLFWRKWLYDLDNRAAQETGYLFEPILASSIGGTPVSAQRSPIKRATNKKKGRQVDCIKQKLAYEFKLRITIAASGQGRWAEELQFPVDCKASRYTPILVVLDPTNNTKLVELTKAFENEGGKVYIGNEAWKHLEEQAGPVMTVFLEKYVRAPLASLLKAHPTDLPPMTVKAHDNGIRFVIGNDTLEIEREEDQIESEDSNLPEDVSD